MRSLPAVIDIRPMGDSVSFELVLQMIAPSYRKFAEFLALPCSLRVSSELSNSASDVLPPLEAKSYSRLAMMGGTIIVDSA